MKIFELPSLKGKDEFVKGCSVWEEGGIAKLLSYQTFVASYNTITKEVSVFDYYSKTTLKHINAFLSYYGFTTCTKKELHERYLS